MKPTRSQSDAPSNKVEVVPIPEVGPSPWGVQATEENRHAEDEGPRHEAEQPHHSGSVHPRNHADQYGRGGDQMDQLRRTDASRYLPLPRDALVDGVSKPTTKNTRDMSQGMGRGKCPAMCMTQHAARTILRDG